MRTEKEISDRLKELEPKATNTDSYLDAIVRTLKWVLNDKAK